MIGEFHGDTALHRQIIGVAGVGKVGRIALLSQRDGRDVQDAFAMGRQPCGRAGQASGALVGVLLPATIFGCVLLHEFGHVLMARRFGIRTRDVTLLPIGGVARLESTGETPRQELAIALAGPAVNLVIALVAGLLVLLMRLPTTPIDPATGAGSFATWLIVSNLFLLGFNLIPAFPMDGGRVLRALLSMKGDRVWATRVAATVGQALAVVLALAGMLALHQPMLLFIALFVWMGASQEAEAVSTSAHLDGVPVRKAMMTEFRTVSPFDTLGEVATAITALQGAMTTLNADDATSGSVAFAVKTAFDTLTTNYGNAITAAITALLWLNRAIRGSAASWFASMLTAINTTVICKAATKVSRTRS